MQMEGRCFDVRRHGVVLVRPFLRALALTVVGVFLLTMPWPVPLAGPLVIGIAAIMAFAAVWRWDRTRFVVTSDKVFLVEGVARKKGRGSTHAGPALDQLEQSFWGGCWATDAPRRPARRSTTCAPRRARDLVEHLAH
jgi:hypothetical protein